MSTTNSPRINVTLREAEYQAIKEYATVTKTSLSNAILKLALEGLEEYEDMLLGEKAISRWKSAKPENWITSDEFWKQASEL